MERRSVRILLDAGLEEAVAERLVASLGFSSDLIPGDDEEAVLLRGAVAAAGDPALVPEALPLLMGLVESRRRVVSLYERGVLAHLRGLLAWRRDDDVPAATRLFNASLARLDVAEARQVSSYIGRVHDSVGQLLLHQGLLADARESLERALACKESCGDDAGMALTLGNLGRLCMTVGDFDAAATYLERDLDWVTASLPHAVGLHNQLATELGVCRLELGDLEGAYARLHASLGRAREASDDLGLAFASVYLGRLALRRGDVESALRHADETRAILDGRTLPKPGVLLGLHALLRAEAEACRGNLEGALPHFEAADAHYETAPSVSPVEHAGLLAAHADACLAAGRRRAAAGCLRRALLHLDATTAGSMRAQVDQRLREVDESAWMLHSTGRFVGHEEIQRLLDEAGQTGFRGREETVTVLFSDLRGFTRFSEGLEPEEVVSLLNRYLARMTGCVEHFGGMVDKFIGDAVMALFSLPQTHADDADRAVDAAFFMQAEIERFNRSLPGHVAPFSAGIGLHHGAVVAGLIGSPQKRSYTVIGDVVNTASRLEGMTKHLGVSTLVTGDVVARMVRPERWVLVPLGCFRPKGRAAPVEAFHLAGVNDGGEESRAGLRRAAASREAVGRLQGRDFEGARRAFELLRDHADGATGALGYARLAEQAALLGATPPPADWDGSIELMEK